jgi:hypothetical protein
MKLDQPAMPSTYTYMDSVGILHTEYLPGFSGRELAAIHLCVPDSGNDELDAMIRRAQRDRFAMEAMKSFMSATYDAEVMAGRAALMYKQADAVIAAGEVGK